MAAATSTSAGAVPNLNKAARHWPDRWHARLPSFPLSQGDDDALGILAGGVAGLKDGGYEVPVDLVGRHPRKGRQRQHAGVYAMEPDPSEPTAVGALADDALELGVNRLPLRILGARGVHQRRGGMGYIRYLPLGPHDPGEVQPQVRGALGVASGHPAEVFARILDRRVLKGDGEHGDYPGPVAAPAPGQRQGVVSF